MLRDLLVFAFIGVAASQSAYKVCIPTNPTLCQSLDKDGSQAVCEPVETRVDCAIKMARGEADLAVYSEEELLLLAQQQPNDHVVVGNVVETDKDGPYAFEAVAVVPVSLTGGFEGLRAGNYCHPGFDDVDQRWSPKVLKAFENLVARTDRCPDTTTSGKTAEELEAEVLNGFFSNACRPGSWSATDSVDTDLKSKYSSLCSICGANRNGTCTGYTYDMGVQITGVRNDNRHIQALECLRQNSQGNKAVAYVAWQHVKEFFSIRAPQLTTAYALLCQDGSTQVLTAESLTNTTAPCSIIRQPWKSIVVSTSKASSALTDLKTWWPNGQNPRTNTWQSVLYSGIIGGTNVQVVFPNATLTPYNYTSQYRNLTSIDATSSCLSAHRWCTISADEYTKCTWIRTAAFSLGVLPAISCQQRTGVFECLQDISDNRADFMSIDSNYGFLARQHYKLSPVKLLQNSRSSATAFSRITALVKTNPTGDSITRFENLRGKKACFPEFGGIAYVAFVRTAHERGVISSSQCDYARGVGEFFDGACAGGADDAGHIVYESSSFNSSILCSVCKPSTASTNTTAANSYTCAWDNSNLYFGNNGSLACLTDPVADVAFVEVQNLEAELASLNLDPTQFRALCRNNTLAVTSGISGIDENCLLAYIVDSEIVARRNDNLLNSLNSLLDTLDLHFGYNAAFGTQLINLEIYSPFDNKNNLLFRDSAVGLTEPSVTAAHEPAKNYIELFQHLESCTGGAISQFGNRNIYSLLTLVVMTVLTRFVIME